MADEDIALEWRPVQGFPPYEISNTGSVRRVSYVKPRINPKTQRLHISLRDSDGVIREHLVANLVAEAFLPPPVGNGYRVSFRDGDKENIRPGNLFWSLRPGQALPEGDHNWRDIPGFSHYQISETGIIRRLTKTRNGCKPGHIMRGTVHPNTGHIMMKLRTDAGGKQTKGVHHLLALAFHGPRPTPRHVAAHNDGKPTNNHYKNIRWATTKENCADKIIHNTMPYGEKNGNSRLSNEDVIRIRISLLDYDKGLPRRLAEEYGVTPNLIRMIKTGKIWNNV